MLIGSFSPCIFVDSFFCFLFFRSVFFSIGIVSSFWNLPPEYHQLIGLVLGDIFHTTTEKKSKNVLKINFKYFWSHWSLLRFAQLIIIYYKYCHVCRRFPFSFFFFLFIFIFAFVHDPLHNSSLKCFSFLSPQTGGLHKWTVIVVNWLKTNVGSVLRRSIRLWNTVSHICFRSSFACCVAVVSFSAPSRFVCIKDACTDNVCSIY